MIQTIGLTGGIGSGKSVCARCFECFGIPVYYADDEAKRIMVTDLKLIRDIKSFLGNEAYNEDNSLNKPFISQRIFSDKSLLSKMNAAVHPAVIRDFNEWASNQIAPYVIQENALIADSDRFDIFDTVIAVVSPIELRIERLLFRDKTTKEAIMARINNQASDDQRMNAADHIIFNDNAHSIIVQCIDIHKRLKENAI